MKLQQVNTLLWLKWKEKETQLHVLVAVLLFGQRLQALAEPQQGFGGETVCVVHRRLSRTLRWGCSAECTSNSPKPGCAYLHLLADFGFAVHTVQPMTASGARSSYWSAEVEAGLQPRVLPADQCNHTESRLNCHGSSPACSVGRTSGSPPCWPRSKTTEHRAFAEGLHRWSSEGPQLRSGKYSSHKPTGSSGSALNQMRNCRENQNKITITQESIKCIDCIGGL